MLLVSLATYQLHYLIVSILHSAETSTAIHYKANDYLIIFKTYYLFKREFFKYRYRASYS